VLEPMFAHVMLGQARAARVVRRGADSISSVQADVYASMNLVTVVRAGRTISSHQPASASWVACRKRALRWCRCPTPPH
jgi:hypothetical protein